jgi:hypothetical protein
LPLAAQLYLTMSKQMSEGVGVTEEVQHEGENA